MAFQFLVAQDWKHFHLAKNKQINKQYTSIRLFIFHHLLITSNYVLIHLYNSLSLWGWQGIGHSLERLWAHHRANTERKSFEVFVLYHNLVSLNWRHFHLKEMSFLIQKWKAKFPTLCILSSRKDSKMTIVIKYQPYCQSTRSVSVYASHKEKLHSWLIWAASFTASPDQLIAQFIPFTHLANLIYNILLKVIVCLSRNLATKTWHAG